MMHFLGQSTASLQSAGAWSVESRTQALLEKIATKTGKGGSYELADFGMNGVLTELT
ncbi:hypothetical protein [Streptomyces olivaceoviridis]|uniref:hypothetical protein n=1 Tax=Streptomyces olivaceoviridis TaxID=1921 RepID=UPI00332A0D06